MSNKPPLIVLASLSLFLTACSQQNVYRPTPLTPLKAISAKDLTAVTKTVWAVNTDSKIGNYTVKPHIYSKAIYVAGGVSASAWNKNNGKQIWKANIGETISAGVSGSSNNSKNNNQQVFIGTTNGNAISLNASTGKIQWIERLSGEVLAISPSENGRVVFRTNDGTLHGLSSKTGEFIWQRSQRTPALTIMGASTPIIIGGNIVSGFDNGKVAAYNLQNGAPAWEVTLAYPRGRSDLDRIVDIDGTVVAVDTALFASTMNGNINGVDIANGVTAWSKNFSSATGVSVNSLGLYSSDDKGNIWKFKPQSGEMVWKIDDLQRYEPTLPILVGSSLIVVGDKKGNLHWINTKTGKFVARTKGDSTGYSIEPAVDGSSIFALGKSGTLSKITVN